jgi:hypothetical protein
MNANLYFIEDYENETTFRPKKTNPKQTQFKPNLVRRRRIPKAQNELKIACQKIWPHPQKRKKKWIIVEQSYILAGILLYREICLINNVQV